MADEVISNEDLLSEILLRVPVKPLLRFKSVSKRWFALISDSKFCHSHTLHLYKSSSHPFPSSLMLYSSNHTPYPSPIPPQCPIINIPLAINSNSVTYFRHLKIPRMSVTIMQSSNGLFLIEGMEDVNDPLNEKHFVYNPTTNKYLAVNYPSSQFSSTIFRIFLFLEPLKSQHYKIVTIRIDDFSSLSASNVYNNDFELILNVYSSETGSWTTPGVSFPGSLNPEVVCCNGALFWWSDNSLEEKYFDVEKLCFKKYLMPTRFMKDKRVNYYGESGGYFQVVLQSNSMVDLEFDVLELSEDRSEWSVRFHMKLDSLRLLDLLLARVYCVVRDKLLVFVIKGKFMACDYLDSSIKQLPSFRQCLNLESRFDVFHYNENLSSVDPSN